MRSRLRVTASRVIAENLEPRTLMASISGHVFIDFNANGKQDSGETTGASDNTQVIFIDSNNNGIADPGEQSTAVDAFGNFSFNIGAKGTYRVTLQQDSGYIRTDPAVDFYSETITNTTQNITGVLFGITQQASVFGTIYNDANGNGKQDSTSTEPPLGGATAYLDVNGNGSLDSSSKTISSASSLNLNTTNTTAVASDLSVSGTTGVVSDITVTLNVSTANDNDPQIYLENPEGVRVLLVSPLDTVGQSGKHNFTNTVFDDQATTPISNGTAPYTGSFQTSGLDMGFGLSNFNGMTANGSWRLIVQSTAVGTPMVLNSWSLKVTSGDVAATTSYSGNYFLSVIPGTYAVRATDTNFTTTQPSGGKVTTTVNDGDSHEADFGLHETTTRNKTVTFNPPVKLNNGTTDSPFDIVSGNFNGDSNPDLATSDNGSNDVAIYLGKGNGAFNNPTFLTAGAAPRGMAEGDFNKDGHTDLVVANHDDNNVEVFLGNGNGTFKTGVIYPGVPGAWDIVVGDFNNDGNLDLAVGGNDTNQVQILLGKGNGTFTKGALLTSGFYPTAMVAADINGDKNLDLVTANSMDDTVSILLGNGKGGFGSPITTSVGSAPGDDPDGLAVGDFNNDKKPDLVVTNSGDNTLEVLIWKGNGTFSSPVIYPTGSAPAAATVADINQDGKPDLVISNESDGTTSPSGSVMVFLGNGDGTFNSPFTYTTDKSPVATVAVDLNGDGYPEIAAANFFSDDVSVLIDTTKPAPTGTGKISGTVTTSTGGVSGETVYLDANNNSKFDPGELKTVTGTAGAYSFSNVPVGTYVIRQVLLTGYSQTSPAGGSGIHITITAGSSLTSENFVDSLPAPLTGAIIGTSSSYNNDGDTIAKAFDGNASTFFNGPTANGDWVGLDLGSAKTIGEVTYLGRSGFGSRMVGGKIQVSTTANFSSGVTTIYTITSAPADGVSTAVLLSSPVTARYIRYLAPDGAYGNIAELAFYG